MKKSILRPALLGLMLLVAWAAQAANVIATWNFQTMAAGAVSLQKTTGTVASDVEGIVLTVDATTGKLQSRGSDAQMNQGTIIRVPVKTPHDIVTVSSYPNYHNYTVGGTAAEADLVSHKATTAEAGKGYVEIVGTGSSYLYLISVEQVSMIQEKTLYATTFTEWTDAKAAPAESTTKWQTKYSHEDLTFSIYNTMVSSTNQNAAKFPDWTGGYLMCSKSADPYILTSPLNNITRVNFRHGATGSNRGWRLEAKGDGDADWVVLSSEVATDAKGTDVSVEVNRTHCQLRFTNLNPSQNAYLFSVEILGNVDMGQTPTLGSFSFGGVTYQAADIFTETADGQLTATIEVSKKGQMPSATLPLTDLTAANGEVGTPIYAADADGATVTLPVTANGETKTYVARFVWKADMTLTYYDADGRTVIGTQQVEKDATIGTFAYGADKVTTAEGSKFRGWAQAIQGKGNRKYVTTDVITAPTSLYALVTPIETQSTTARYTYDLTDPCFDAADHEAYTFEGTGKFHDNVHGWQMADGDRVTLAVGGKAYIVAQLCRYGGKATIDVVNSKGEVLHTINTPAATDGALGSYYYEGGADMISLVCHGAPYIHQLKLINVEQNAIARNAAGYYVVKAGDADHLLSTLEIANANAGSERTYIYVPRGTYDLGETVLTPISGDNISIVGEDRDETVILNRPQTKNEGIGTTATLLITGQNTYLQDLTLQNALDYYATGAAGRAVVIQDKGHRTICKNVKMLSYQDTYYSNADGQYYFEGGEIHGTVDYLCGSGDVFFHKVTFVNESRKADTKSGEDVIAAPYPGDNVQYGYVMDSCTVVNHAAAFSFGRSWGGKSKLAFLHTTLMQPDELSASRFTPAGMNTAAYSFREFASTDAEGHILTPANHEMTFTKDKTSYTYNTTLTAEEASRYAIGNVFADWQPKELARQAEVTGVTLSEGQLSWSPVAQAPAYAVYADGKLVALTTATTLTAEAGVKQYTVRAANAMGGLGVAVAPLATTAIQAAATATALTTTYYALDGMRLSQPRRGVNICVSTLADGSKTVQKVMIK